MAMSGSRVIRGVLLDSGHTLVRPIGGEWFPGRAFREAVAACVLDGLDWRRLASAHRAGMAYLEEHHQLTTEAEECDQFQVYCERVLDGLGVSALPAGLAREIATRMVDETAMEPYPDVAPMLERWRSRGLRLGVLSNSWPSLDRHYRALGLREYFDAFVISARVGCLKPDARIFAVAFDELGLAPGEVLFVDDSPENVAARALGMHGVVIAREGRPPDDDVPWATSLGEVDELLARMAAG